MTGSAFWQKSAAFLLFLLSVAIFSSFSPAFAKEASPLAQDETAEKRLVDISSELRCLVCQNESLSGSQAELANDLRREIRTLIKDGKSDSEIMDFMVNRYGDFVRYKPALTGKTALLWFGPAGLLLAGMVVMVVIVRRRRAAPTDGSDALSAEERQRLDQLLDTKTDD